MTQVKQSDAKDDALSSVMEASHQLEAMDVVASLRSDAKNGLSASLIEERLRQHGPNELPEEQAKSWGRIFASQFASPLIYILLAAAIIAFAMGHHGDAVVILVVVLANSLIGAFQEGRAEQSMSALRKLSALKVRVKREGREQEIEARALVPGDIVLMAAGDAVGADARLIEAAALECMEAALTGESLPVQKSTAALPADTSLGDRTNMVFSGTHVTTGRGRAVVVATGTKSEVGKIAEITAGAEEPATPLEARLKQFGHWLAAAALVLFAIVLGLGVMRQMPFLDVFMVAISQMVSMVPEGLPVAVTIALAVGMQRMARRGVIVRRLAAVETLGSTSIICSDKTGTLTKNEMTVTMLVLPDERRVEVTGTGYSPTGVLRMDGSELAAEDDRSLHALLEAITLCNDAQVVPPSSDSDRWRPLGDPTEAALLTVALKGCIEIDRLRHQQPRSAELPFDSATKLMATQHGHGETARVIIKGAPERLLDLCEARSVDREEFDRVFEALAAEALRVLAVAVVEGVSIDEAKGFEPFKGRARFLGIVGQMDPPREEVREAVAECFAAGVRPVMVTGDHKATGLAIAQKLGIARPEDMAIDGAELEAMSEQDLRAALPGVSVFARVHPAQKLRIVEAFQSLGHVVAMTGDGVNDAPALARADVGVAMGITGTEVAKGASKIVITDDNFATIVKAIEQGRLVYRNLKKVILFLFATSLDEVLVLMTAMILGYPLPLAAVQILWINIVTEGTVTVNLIMEQLEGDELDRPPIPKHEALITPRMFRRLLLMVTTSAAAIFGFFHWRLATGVPFDLVQTETFTLVAVSQWFNVLNCRSATHSAITSGVMRNRWIVGGLLLAVILQALVIYAPPLNRIFHTVPIPAADLLIIVVVGSAVLWAEEVRKWISRARSLRTS